MFACYRTPMRLFCCTQRINHPFWMLLGRFSKQRKEFFHISFSFPLKLVFHPINFSQNRVCLHFTHCPNSKVADMNSPSLMLLSATRLVIVKLLLSEASPSNRWRKSTMREKKWIDCPACGAKKSMRIKKNRHELLNPPEYPPLDIAGLDGQFCNSCGEGFWSLKSERLIALNETYMAGVSVRVY